MFASLATVRAMLGISGGTCSGTTRYDDAINVILPAVDQIVLDELGFPSTSALTTYTDYIDINAEGQTEVALKYRPVSSVVGLTIGGEAVEQSTAAEQKGYVLNKDLGVIKLDPLYSVIPSGRAVVQCTYVAGFSSIPADISYAASLIAVSLFNQQSHLGFVSEKTAGYSYNTGNAEGSFVPAMARRILNKHRRLFARGDIYGSMD